MKKRKKYMIYAAGLWCISALAACSSGKTEEIACYSADKVPEHYEDVMENVTFQMDICLPDAAENRTLVKTGAIPKKADFDAAVSAFAQNADGCEISEGKAVNESGNYAEYSYYFMPDGEQLGIGPYSSAVTYTVGSGVNPVLSVFNLEKRYEDYNADQFLTGNEFPFADIKKAEAEVYRILDELKISPDSSTAVVYSLDHAGMEEAERKNSTEYAETADVWNSDDDCYYIAVQQTYRDIPVYHPYYKVFTGYEDANAPVQAIYSKRGIVYLSTELVFEFEEGEEEITLQPFERIIQTAAEKYNRILGNISCTYTDANLYYMVNVKEGKNKFEVFPVWILEGYQNTDTGETGIQIIINAETGEEMV